MLWTAGRSLPVRHCRVDSKFTSAFLIFNKVVSPPENLDAVDDRWFGFPQNVFQFALCRGNRSIETRVEKSLLPPATGLGQRSLQLHMGILDVANLPCSGPRTCCRFRIQLNGLIGWRVIWSTLPGCACLPGHVAFPASPVISSGRILQQDNPHEQRHQQRTMHSSAR